MTSGTTGVAILLEAFDGAGRAEEESLALALRGLTPAEAKWQPPAYAQQREVPGLPPAGTILWHVVHLVHCARHYAGLEQGSDRREGRPLSSDPFRRNNGRAVGWPTAEQGDEADGAPGLELCSGVQGADDRGRVGFRVAMLQRELRRVGSVLKAAPPKKGMKLTKIRPVSFAAYPRCWTDLQRWAMTKAGWALILAAALGLSGCYDFESPLDATPQLPRDEALLGEWRCLSADPGPSEQAMTLVFSAARDREYVITFTEEGKKPEHLGGYASAVSGGTVLNLRDPDREDSNEPWNLVRYSFLLPNLIRFELVDDDPFGGVQATPAALRSALERLGAQPGVYSDLCICLRIAKKDSQ